MSRETDKIWRVIKDIAKKCERCGHYFIKSELKYVSSKRWGYFCSDCLRTLKEDGDAAAKVLEAKS